MRPAVIIETGTYRGGLAYFFATLFEFLGLSRSMVITMDAFSLHDNFNNLDNNRICPVCAECVRAYETPAWKRHVVFFEGNSWKLASRVQKAMHEAAEGPVLLSLDSQHSYENVLAELHQYAPLVTSGSYIIVQDSKIDLIYGRVGPATAADHLMRHNPGMWKLDFGAARHHGYSQHLWLRKVGQGQAEVFSLSDTI